MSTFLGTAHILLEGLRLRKESEARIEQLEQELKSLYEQRIELQKLSEGEKIPAQLVNVCPSAYRSQLTRFSRAVLGKHS